MMDACEWANFLAGELLMQQLVSLDGIQSCVPTRTTATLTPTTMRNIEQTYMELTDLESSKPGQAGFVPPLPSFPEQDYSTGLSSIESSNGSWQTPPPQMSDEIVGNLQQTTETKRGRGDSRKNMGGRRPNRASNLTAEEEEKRRVRRQRNKEAAARCRKRRVDQTNELTGQVEKLDREKKKLQEEIKNLQELKHDLEYNLKSHETSLNCVLSRNRGNSLGNIVTTTTSSSTDLGVDTKSYNPIDFVHLPIKEEPLELIEPAGPSSPKRMLLSSTSAAINVKPETMSIGSLPSLGSNAGVMKRPNSLNLGLKITSSQSGNNSIADLAGISITTPSSGFNYISLMNGGTGLTPVHAPLQPTLHGNSSMLRNSMDLQTPTSEPSKLVSL